MFAQRLLVLLFGTFRVIAMHGENGGLSGMSSEALGVSVAPSILMSCIGTHKQAKLEDIRRYKMASKIISFIIENFAVSNLFGRENYEYYARITGRVLRVDDDWIFAFDYPHEKLLKATSKIARRSSVPLVLLWFSSALVGILQNKSSRTSTAGSSWKRSSGAWP